MLLVVRTALAGNLGDERVPLLATRPHPFQELGLASGLCGWLCVRSLGVRYERRVDLLQEWLHLARALIGFRFLAPATG